MQEKAKARLRELAPPGARRSQEAGSTQPSLCLFLHVCTYKVRSRESVDITKTNKRAMNGMAMEFLYCRHIEKMKLTKLTKLSIVYSFIEFITFI